MVPSSSIGTAPLGRSFQGRSCNPRTELPLTWTRRRSATYGPWVSATTRRLGLSARSLCTVASVARLCVAAVLGGAYTLDVIVDSDDQTNVEWFMTLFTQVGSVEILPSSACEAVVARARC